MTATSKKYRNAAERDEAYGRIYHEARDAGVLAAQKQLQELQGQGPAYVVKSGNTVVGTMLDVCGFASVIISKGNSSYARWAKKQDNLAHSAYRGGTTLFIRATQRQELSVNRAACEAAAEILRSHGIEVHVESRID